MTNLLCNYGDLKIWAEDGRFYALYDAGSHQVVMRRDEITEEEAKLACSGERGATQMLSSLQRRLEQAGMDPYSSNIEK